MAGTLEDLLTADTVLVVGIDPLEETPALGWKVKLAARRYDSNVIVANSREISLDPFARVRLRIRPYSESDLVLGLMKLILDTDLWDKKFVRDQTSNFLSMKKLLDKISLKGILNRTGVAPEDLEEAARILGEAPQASIVFGGDVILQEDGLQCVMNLVNLALLTGNLGRPGAGVYPIFEKGNVVGLCDMGVMPEYLPGYQDAAVVRDRLERIWKTPLPYGKGRTVPEIVRGLETGDVKAVYIAAADPLTDYPNAGRFAAALEKAELVVVQDMFLSPTAAAAHCVLPAASFAEKDGTMTNIERRIQRLNQVIPPLGASMPDWSILEEVAKAMGRPMGFFKVNDVFNEMARTIPLYKGLRLQDVDGDGRIVRPEAEAVARARSGRPYSFAPVRTIEDPIKDAETYPFEMMADRCMYHFGSTSTRSEHLLELCPAGYVKMNARDADDLGISEGDAVEVASPAGSFVAPAKISWEVRKGMIFVPVNFPDLAVYRLFQENTTTCMVKLSPVRGTT